MRRVPGCVENDDTVGGNQINTQASGARRNQEEPGPKVVSVVENIAPVFAQLGRCGSVETEVIGVQIPGTDRLFLFCLTEKKKKRTIQQASFKITKMTHLILEIVSVLFHPLSFSNEELFDEVERHEALAEHEDLVANQFALAEDVHEQNQLAAVLDLHHVVIVDELRPPGTRQGRSDPQFFLGRRPFSTTGTSTRFPAIDRLGFFFIC